MPFAAVLGALARGGASFGARAGIGAAEGYKAAGGLQTVNTALKETATASRAGQKGLSSWNQSLQNFHNTASRATADLFFLRGAFEGLSGKLVGSLTSAASVLDALAAPIKGIVGLHAPGTLKAYEIALNDTMAAMGEAATPMLEAFTRAMRTVGDVFAGLEPVVEPALTAIGEAVEKTVKAWAEYVKDNAPTIELFADVIAKVATAAGYAARGLMTLLNALNFITPIARGLGFGGKSDPNAKSAGKAVRDVTITGSTEEFARKAQEEAFRNASAGRQKKDPQEETVNWLEQIKQFLDANLTTAKLIELVVLFANEVKNQAKESGQAAGSGAGSVAGGPMAMIQWIRNALTS